MLQSFPTISFHATSSRNSGTAEVHSASGRQILGERVEPPSLPGPTAWFSGKLPSCRHPIFHWQRWEEGHCDFWSKAVRFQNVAPLAVFFLLRYLPSSCAWCINSNYNVSCLIWYMHIRNFTLYVSLHAIWTRNVYRYIYKGMQGIEPDIWSNSCCFCCWGPVGETTRLFAAHEKVLVCTDRWDGWKLKTLPVRCPVMPCQNLHKSSGSKSFSLDSWFVRYRTIF